MQTKGHMLGPIGRLVLEENGVEWRLAASMGWQEARLRCRFLGAGLSLAGFMHARSLPRDMSSATRAGHAGGELKGRM